MIDPNSLSEVLRKFVSRLFHANLGVAPFAATYSDCDVFQA